MAIFTSFSGFLNFFHQASVPTNPLKLLFSKHQGPTWCYLQCFVLTSQPYLNYLLRGTQSMTPSSLKHLWLGFWNTIYSWVFLILEAVPPPPLSLNECIPLSCGISWWLGLLGPLQGRAVCTSRGVGRGGVSASRSWGWEPGERKASGFKGHLKQAQSLTQPEFIGVIRWGQVPQGNCGMPHNKREKGSGLHKVWVPS